MKVNTCLDKKTWMDLASSADVTLNTIRWCSDGSMWIVDVAGAAHDAAALAFHNAVWQAVAPVKHSKDRIHSNGPGSTCCYIPKQSGVPDSNLVSRSKIW